MTQKEKMLKGELYNGYDQELVKERQWAKEMVYQLNTLNPTQVQQKNEIFSKLVNVGENFFIEPPFRCDYGYNIHIGDHFYSNYNLVILDGAKVTIGNHVLIGPNVSIYAAGHPLDPTIREQDLEFTKEITIQDNVWIGGSAILNPGVTIGKNSIIGSGSVVTKDIPQGVVAVGNPCKVIRKIETINNE